MIYTLTGQVIAVFVNLGSTGDPFFTSSFTGRARYATIEECKAVAQTDGPKIRDQFIGIFAAKYPDQNVIVKVTTTCQPEEPANAA